MRTTCWTFLVAAMLAQAACAPVTPRDRDLGTGSDQGAFWLDEGAIVGTQT